MKPFPIFSLAAALAVTACVEPAPLAPVHHEIDGPPGTVAVESNPPGATIEVNGRGVGPAPCTAPLPLILANGKWVLKQDVTILALPEEKGQAPQTKFYEAFTAPPLFVAFDMRSNPHPPKLPDSVDQY